jgi:hypothetical protein
MTPEELDQHMALNEKKIASLTRFWKHSLPSVEAPGREQFLLWLRMFDFDFDVVIYGITETMKKSERLGGRMSQDHAIRFTSKCCISYRKAKALPRLPADRFIQSESYGVAA